MTLLDYDTQQYIFYFIILVIFIAVIVFVYNRNKRLEKERLDGFEPSSILSGQYAVCDSDYNELDPFAFNPVLIDVMQVEQSCLAQESIPVPHWYLAVIERGERSSKIALIKPDFTESLAVNINSMLRSERVLDSQPGERSVWEISRVGKGWAIQHEKSGLYLSWSDCKVGVKSFPDESCVLRLKRFDTKPKEETEI
jgi:hypothetical protein